MKLKTRQITVTAILLAICIVSQFFKNLNVYITGPIINAALILTTVYAGLACGIILSVITPITSFFIAAPRIHASKPPLSSSQAFQIINSLLFEMQSYPYCSLCACASRRSFSQSKKQCDSIPELWEVILPFVLNLIACCHSEWVESRMTDSLNLSGTGILSISIRISP